MNNNVYYTPNDLSIFSPLVLNNVYLKYTSFSTLQLRRKISIYSSGIGNRTSRNIGTHKLTTNERSIIKGFDTQVTRTLGSPYFLLILALTLHCMTH